MNSLSISAHEGTMTTRNNRMANRKTITLEGQDQLNAPRFFGNNANQEELDNLKKKNEELLGKIELLEAENETNIKKHKDQIRVLDT